MQGFFRVQLRSIEVERDVVPLRESSLARGARPHWLGYLHVGSVAEAAATFTAQGAQTLATWVNPEGLEAAVMRDAGGALVALARPAEGTEVSVAANVGWCVLNTPEVERAKANYSAVAGWHCRQPTDLGELGIFHPFSWQANGPAAGVMADLNGRPGVHPHWLFAQKVESFERAFEAVTAHGGAVLEPWMLPSGEWFAVCDDPQGAAFGLQGS